MASEIQIGVGAGEKKGLYSELRQNPYLLGLSTVRRYFNFTLFVFMLTPCSSPHSVASFLVTIKALYR